MKRMHEYNNEDEPLILFSKATCLYLVVVGKPVCYIQNNVSITTKTHM